MASVPEKATKSRCGVSLEVVTTSTVIARLHYRDFYEFLRFEETISEETEV